MMNFSVGELYSYLWSLRHEEEMLQGQAIMPAALGGFGSGGLLGTSALSGIKKRLSALIEKIKKIADRHKFELAQHRISRFDIKVRFPCALHEFIGDIRALREALEDDMWTRFFYCYPKVRGDELVEMGNNWKPVIENFAIARNDIFAAVDCWALDHGTASVFHLMRAAEHGLRALARERRVKLPRKQVLEWAVWRAVIDAIGKKVDLIANRKRGPAREAALEFYRGALGSLEGFKDAYRNNVMHTRKSYTAQEALAVMHHVREFMNRLASMIDETGKKQIKWGIR